MIHKMHLPPSVLTIAGSDPSGHAGIQADILTMTNLGVKAQAVVTAVTAQSQRQFDEVNPVDPSVLEAQLVAISRDPAPAAIKTGLIPLREHMPIISRYLQKVQKPYICDPVLAASSGRDLVPHDWIAAWKKYLLPHISLLTPNLPELATLTGRPIPKNKKDVTEATRQLLHEGCSALLVKGGHDAGDWVHDYYADQKETFWLSNRRLPFQCRGTGCTLSAAITSAIARRFLRRDAVTIGKAMITEAIANSIGDDPAFHTLSLKTWPPHRDSMPAICSEPREDFSSTFPSMGNQPIGFYPVVDSISWLKRLIPLGTTTLQLRIKEASTEVLQSTIREAVELGREAGIRLFINDHWRLAIEAGAYGVHLGQEDLDTADLDAIRNAGLRLGVSTHSYQEACRAATLRPSYIALGPIFPTTCKSMAFGPQGIEKISEWKQLFPVPLVAIGGLKEEHIDPVMQAGADGVAVISDITQSPEPEQRARAWLTKINQALS